MSVLEFFGFKSAQSPPPAIHFPYTYETNPYKCQRTWPPDFKKLDQKHQFSLERRYRRRMKLKYIRPGWIKGTKLAQYGIILAVVVYGVVEMDILKIPTEESTMR